MALMPQMSKEKRTSRRIKTGIVLSKGSFRKLATQNDQIEPIQQYLSDTRREKDSQIQQLQLHLSDVQRDNEHLHRGLGPKTSPSHSQEIEFWRVSPKEVQVGQEILGRGACMGIVAKRKFRGQKVAYILQQTTMDCIRREIRTMAQVRHPNLVLFITAVIDDQN